MKVKTQLAGILGVCAVLALPASAQDTRWYFNAAAGGNWAQDAAIKIENIGSGDLELDLGVRFSAGVGYNLNKNWSVEFDTGFTFNSIDKIKIGSESDSFHDSSFSHVPLMVNLVYRYPLGAQWETYIGGGAGGVYSVLTLDESDLDLDDDDADVVFGWQAMAGVRYLIRENMSVGVGYKYMGTAKGEYEINDLGKVEIESVHNHSFGAVFNWKF